MLWHWSLFSGCTRNLHCQMFWKIKVFPQAPDPDKAWVRSENSVMAANTLCAHHPRNHRKVQSCNNNWFQWSWRVIFSLKKSDLEHFLENCLVANCKHGLHTGSEEDENMALSMWRQRTTTRYARNGWLLYWQHSRSLKTAEATLTSLYVFEKLERWQPLT